MLTQIMERRFFKIYTNCETRTKRMHHNFERKKKNVSEMKEHRTSSSQDMFIDLEQHLSIIPFSIFWEIKLQLGGLKFTVEVKKQHLYIS